MAYISFLHVADLYLDSALSASFLSHDNVTQYVQDAPYNALENLMHLCEIKRPDFVLLSGDMYSSENVSLKARFALALFYEKLAALSIPLYHAHGRHNPLTAKSKKEIASFKELDMPAYLENVYHFSDTWECFTIRDDVKIYGISHSKRQESRNLVDFFEKHGQTIDKNCLNIGVLYTSLMGASTFATSYGAEQSSLFLSPYFESYDEIFDLPDYGKERELQVSHPEDLEHAQQNINQNPFINTQGIDQINQEMQDEVTHNSQKRSRKLALENLKESVFLKDKASSSLYIAPELQHASNSQKSLKSAKPKKSELYAPCTINDLAKINMDYWALGYWHKAQNLQENPPVAFAGSMQALHVHETGAHGCLFVEIDKKNNTFTAPKTSFYSLAPVEWHELHVDLQNLAHEIHESDLYADRGLNSHDFMQNQARPHIAEEQEEALSLYAEYTEKFDKQLASQLLCALQKIILQALQEYLQKVWIGQKCNTILFRVLLHGQSEYASLLQGREFHTDLSTSLERLINASHSQEAEGLVNPFWDNLGKISQRSKNLSIYFKDIKSLVRPLFDFESALGRDDILGEILRVSRDLRNDNKALRAMEKQASDLLRTKITKFTSNLGDNSTTSALLEQKNFMEIIDKAEEICLEVFEPEQK